MPDFFKCEIRTSINDIVTKVHLHYEQTLGAPDPLSCVGAEKAFRDHAIAEFRDILATDARVESTKFSKIDGATIPAWRGNYQAFIGTGGTNATPANNCMILNLRNDAGLLDRPGRLFISGIGNSDIIGGVLRGASFTAALNALFAKLLTIPLGGTPGWGGELRVRRLWINKIKQDPPVYVPVTSMDATPEMGTQHVRKGELTGYVV